MLRVKSRIYRALASDERCFSLQIFKALVRSLALAHSRKLICGVIWEQSSSVW